jgi:hypothetical protein
LTKGGLNELGNSSGFVPLGSDKADFNGKTPFSAFGYYTKRTG